MGSGFPKLQAVILTALVVGLFCGTQCAQAEKCVPPRTNIVSWWPGNGTASDARGLNQGKYLGNDIPKLGKGFDWRLFLRRIFKNDGYRPGKVGRAFNFDGFVRHVRVPDSPSLHFTDAMTVEAWVNPVSYNPSSGAILCKYDGVLGVNQSAFSFTVDAQGFGTMLISTDGIPSHGKWVGTKSICPLNKWTHLAATYDGKEIVIYYNGKAEGSLSLPGGIFPGTDDLGIGANVGGMPQGSVAGGFIGMIDEPAIYNRALSAEEIRGIYDAGSAGKCLPMSFGWIIGLAAVLLAMLLVVWMLVRLRRRKTAAH